MSTFITEDEFAASVMVGIQKGRALVALLDRLRKSLDDGTAPLPEDVRAAIEAIEAEPVHAKVQGG